MIRVNEQEMDEVFKRELPEDHCRHSATAIGLRSMGRKPKVCSAQMCIFLERSIPINLEYRKIEVARSASTHSENRASRAIQL